MPYIVKEMRTMIDQRATNVLSLVGQLYPGELSYLLTQVVLHWINVDPRTRPDGSRRLFNVRWYFYHVLEHFAGHFGQILMLKHMRRDASKRS